MPVGDFSRLRVKSAPASHPICGLQSRFRSPYTLKIWRWNPYVEARLLGTMLVILDN